jgi:4-hydroxybutyrate dehydrogenase
VALIQYIARIQFAHGARAELPAELALLGVRRPLVMTDGGLIRAGVLATALEALLPGNVAATFDAVPANPTEAAVLAALAAYWEAGCDGIIAVGGGSVIDAAKAVALLATHTGTLAEYRVGGPRTVTRAIAPVISLPTTAGTGSEIGRGAGITLNGGGAKAVFISVYLIPPVAICDPELTASMPPALAAGTGIDALSHCLEAFLSPAVNPPADAVALDGIRRLARHLPDAVARRSNDARWQTMMGAIEGGMAMWKGLGAAHALSMPLDEVGLHHGTVVGVLLPHAIRFVAASVYPERMASLSGALGGGDPADRLAELNTHIGLPPGLRAMGIAEGALPAFAAAAAASPFNQTSARPTGPDGYLSILREAF